MLERLKERLFGSAEMRCPMSEFNKANYSAYWETIWEPDGYFVVRIMDYNSPTVLERKEGKARDGSEAKKAANKWARSRMSRYRKGV